MIAGVLVAVALYGLIRYIVPQKRSETEDDKKRTFNWGPGEAAAITIFLYFFSQLLGGLLVFAAPSLLGLSKAKLESFASSNLGQFVAVASIQLISFGLLMWLLKRRGSSIQAIGLKGKPALKDLGYALVGGLVYVALYAVAAAAIKALVPSLNLEQEQQLGFSNVQNWQLPLIFIALVILPPLVEELTMRGFLYSGLRQKLSLPLAAIATSSLFAVAHLQPGSGAPLLWVAAIDTFVLSMVLVRLREKTGRLWSPIMLHALKNTIAFLALFVFHLA